ncbi:DUF1737 domain-containing protein [Rhodanobacter aciditrophus]
MPRGRADAAFCHRVSEALDVGYALRAPGCNIRR